MNKIRGLNIQFLSYHRFLSKHDHKTSSETSLPASPATDEGACDSGGIGDGTGVG